MKNTKFYRFWDMKEMHPITMWRQPTDGAQQQINVRKEQNKFKTRGR
jgi:hypothetical protein